MTQVRGWIGGLTALAALVVPASALAGPVASTPAFSGGTPTVKTGTPGATGATGKAGAVIALSGTLDRPTPHVAIDDAGTAYVTWLRSTDATSGTPGSIGFCRLPRGASACDNPPATRVITPPAKAYGPADDPAYNQDAGGGAYPVVLGDQLFVVSTRNVTTYATPAGESTTTTIAFASTDGGTTMSGGLPISSGLLLATAPVQFGSDDNPLLGLLGPQQASGSVFAGGPLAFQSIQGGAFSADASQLADAANDGAVAALPGGGVAVQYATDAGRFVRRFPGPGRPAGVGSFSAPQKVATGATSGAGAGHGSLAYGPKGLAIGTVGGTSATLNGRAVVTPVDGGGKQIALTTSTTLGLELAAGGAPGGPLVAAYQLVEDPAADNGLYVRRSANGSTFTSAERITGPKEGVVAPQIAAAPDGGGFAVWATDDGQGAAVHAGAFGPQGKLATPGLPGTVAGSGPGGGGGAVTKECQRIAVAAVQVTTADGVGCFLPGIGASKGTSVSNGPVLYNGLRITPLDGGQVVLDIDEGAGTVTLYTTKDARVDIPSAVAGDITIFQGQLKQQLTAKEGQPVLDLPAYPTVVKGFRVKNALAPLASKGGVTIPVDLDLGPQFLGLTAHGDLVVTPSGGLALDSLHVGAPELGLGPITIDKLDITWTRAGNVWTGSGGMTIPSGAHVGLKVSFDGTSFSADAVYTPPFPGYAVFGPPPVVYLHEISGGVDVNKGGNPLALRGGVKIGAVPIAPGVYALDLDGRMSLTFGDPFVLTATGDLKVLSKLTIATSTFTVRSDGYFRASGKVEIGYDPFAYLGFTADFAVASKGFETEVSGKGCLIVCATAAVHGSTKGIAGCATIAGDGYIATHLWADDLDDVDWHSASSCKAGFQSVSIGLIRGAGRGGPRQVSVPSGAARLSLNARSADGTPAVDLIDPSGAVVAPGTPGVKVVTSPQAHHVYVFVDQPKAGSYRLQAQPGSPPLTKVTADVPAPEPKLKASLGRKGSKRAIRYAVTGNPDVTVSFVERTRSGDKPLDGGGRSGTLTFAPQPLPAGTHNVYARFVNSAGLVTAEQKVGSFDQSAPPRPRAARSVRVTRSGARLRVSITRSGSVRLPFAVGVRYGEGGTASATIAAGRSAAFVRAPGKSLDAPGATRVTVRPRSRSGVLGPARSASLGAKALQRPAKRKRG